MNYNAVSKQFDIINRQQTNSFENILLHNDMVAISVSWQQNIISK